MKPLGGVFEVDAGPLLCCVVAALTAEVVGVGAVLIAGERVVEDACQVLSGKDQSCVFGPTQSEEAGKEVFSRFDHAALGCRTGDNLAVVRVEMTVVVLVQGSGFEKLLLAYWNEDLLSKFVIPVVKEAEIASEGDIPKDARGVVLDLHSQVLNAGPLGGIPRTMTRQHVQLHDGSVLRHRVLINAKAIRVAEVMRQLTVLVENALVIADLTFDRNLSLQWLRRHICR